MDIGDQDTSSNLIQVKKEIISDDTTEQALENIPQVEIKIERATTPPTYQSPPAGLLKVEVEITPLEGSFNEIKSEVQSSDQIFNVESIAKVVNDSKSIKPFSSKPVFVECKPDTQTQNSADILNSLKNLAQLGTVVFKSNPEIFDNKKKKTGRKQNSKEVLTSLKSAAQEGTVVFKCNVCEYISIKRNNVKRHTRIHTNFKPFKCISCDYRSNIEHHVKRHYSHVHAKEKPYECDMCGYKCSEKCNLKKHIAIHLKKKRFKCDLCDFGCNRVGHFNAHKKTHITITIEEQTKSE